MQVFNPTIVEIRSWILGPWGIEIWPFPLLPNSDISVYNCLDCMPYKLYNKEFQ